MSDPTYIICGCVKDCKQYLINVFDNIKKIMDVCNVIKILIAYDKSTDNTLNILNNLSTKFNIELVDTGNKSVNIRTQSICNARNALLNRIKSFNDFIKIDYFIMMDFDDVCSKPINIDVFKNVINKKEWDCVTFNNEHYYDFWALSIDEFKFSCWHWNNNIKYIQYMYNILKTKFNQLNVNDDEFIECDSAFNGFGIYKYDKFVNCHYKTLIDLSIFNMNEIYKTASKLNICVNLQNKYDCEHRYFHMTAKKQNNAKICISKEYLFPCYTGQHANFLYK